MKTIDILTFDQTLRKMGDGEWVRVEDVVELLKGESPYFIDQQSFSYQLKHRKTDSEFVEWLNKRLKIKK